MTSLQDPRWLAMRPAWRDHLLEKHRDINVWDEWWEPTEATFKERCSKIGIYVDKTYFSGFGCQGDGACFEGSIDDWPLFLTHVGLKDQRLHAVAAGHGMWPGWKFRITLHGRYSHAHSVAAAFEFDEVNVVNEFTDPLRHASYQLLLESLDYVALEDQLLEACRDLAKDLYRELEEEHDYLTSDEQVAEYILELDPSELVDPDEEQEATDSCVL